MRNSPHTDKSKLKSQELEKNSGRRNHGTTPPVQTPEGWLWLGQVGRPHGVRGSFFLKTDDNRIDWPGYKKLLIKTVPEKVVAVENAYVSGGKLALQLESVNSREICESLYNTHLFVSRSEIKLEQDEFLVAELVGCKELIDGRTEAYGHVVAVHNFGAQETLEIQPLNHSQDTILFPFVDAFVVAVNESERTITLKDEPAFLDSEQQ
jgi:16S rRNA processing protein RimM